MILKALKYTRSEGEPRQWNITGNGGDYAYFENINLFVGKNAAGKSRTLYVIREISNLLSGVVSLKQMNYPDQSFDLLFREGEKRLKDEGKGEPKTFRYLLELKKGVLVTESLSVGEELYFSRSSDGIRLGQIANGWSTGDKAKVESVEDDTLLITALNTQGVAIFDLFVTWGASLRNYLFADQFEKKILIEDFVSSKETKLSHGIQGFLLRTFYKGQEVFGDAFVDEVETCMHSLGYKQITHISIEKTPRGYCLGIEEDNRYIVLQQDMSQGLFRALSMFIFITYARMKNISTCILIDDIGEGLDFDRSKRMISLIINKIKDSSIQCFMSTNDRQVMNDIPLRYWTVVYRSSSTDSILYDYTNSKDVFDDFKYTGLNNLDFLSTDFYKDGFGTEDEDDDESDE